MRTRRKGYWCFPAFLLSACIVLAQEQVGSIKGALHAQEYQRALDLARSALERSPLDPQLWTLQGVAYTGERRNREALNSFRNALKLSPDYLPALEQEAQLYYEASDLAGIPVLRHILRLRPNDPMSHAMVAVLEYKRGDCAAAVLHFAKSGDLLESQLDGLHAYATCLVRLKQPEAATTVFERAMALQPENPRERAVLASLQLMAHQPQDAINTLQPLLENAPSPQVLQLGANAYESAGDTDKAVNLLRESILLDPHNLDAYLEFAYISFAHESFQVGIDVLNDGITQQPNSAQLYFARGVLYVQVANYAKAEADFDKAYDLDPGQSLTAAAQGLLAMQQNDLDRALASVKGRLARNPDDPVLLYLEADVLAQQGAEPGTPEFQSALRSAKKAVALRPSLAPARSVLAKLYMRAGQHQQAIRQCRIALKIDSKDQTSVYRLIQLLRGSGQDAEIPELLKRLADLRKDAAREQKQRYRYKIVEENVGP